MSDTSRARWWKKIENVTTGLIDLAFPPRCACCSDWGSSPLCEMCSMAMARERLGECCPVCAGNVGPFEASWDGCGACRKMRFRILGTARVGAYSSQAGALIRQYKFSERHDVEPLLIEWMADAVAASRWADRVEAVTYVPTHWRRMFRGRFHVARVLACGVAKRLDLPCVPLLRRTRSGPRQIGLSYNQRTANVRGAFSLIPGASVRGARVLIIDDVRTTGATLEECAKALKRGRVTEIYAAVVARAKGADDDDFTM
jgi:competence protein ComFC